MIEFSLTLPRFHDPDARVPYRCTYDFCRAVDELGDAGGFIGHHSFSPEVRDEAAPFVFLAAIGFDECCLTFATGREATTPEALTCAATLFASEVLPASA
jgi:hypothetical protein